MSPSPDRVGQTLPIQEDDHIAGPDTAAVTVVAYCDFECPYCRHASTIMTRLQDRLGDRLRLVVRHCSLTQKYLVAQQTAEASEAADGSA